MDTQRIKQLLKDYGALGGVLSAVALGIYWGSGIDTKLTELHSYATENRQLLTDTRKNIEGDNGLRIHVERVRDGIEKLKKSNDNLQCSLAHSNTLVWYRDFELTLWSKPIDVLSKPGSLSLKYLENHIKAWQSQLARCDRGSLILNRLRSLSEGMKLYYSSDYIGAYSKFAELDQNTSLTHRFLTAAAGRQADESDSDLWTRRVNIHSRTASDLATREVASSAKQAVLPILICQTYSTKIKEEALKGAECYLKLAKEGIKPSYTYVAAASAYAAGEEYEKAMEMLRRYKVDPFKEIGRSGLERDKDLSKLLNSPYANEYRQILQDLPL